LSDKLPNKIIRLDQIRINRGLDKVCSCKNRKYEIDTTNRRITCSSCGAMIEAYEAMLDLANRWEYMNKQIENLLEQRKQIMNYKPWLVVIKYLEKNYRGRKMLPVCPECNEPFYLEELTKWVAKEYADKRIKNSGRNKR